MSRGRIPRVEKNRIYNEMSGASVACIYSTAARIQSVIMYQLSLSYLPPQAPSGPLPPAMNQNLITTRGWSTIPLFHLQKGSEEADETGKGGDGLGGTSGRRNGAGGRVDGDSAVGGRGGSRGSASGLGAVVADNRRDNSDRAGDGAGALGDGQSSGRSDGVGLGAVGDLGSLGAVGGVDINDLGGDGNVGVGRGTNGDGDERGDGELHFVGIRFWDSKAAK